MQLAHVTVSRGLRTCRQLVSAKEYCCGKLTSMMNAPHRLWSPVALICALTLAGCASDDAPAPSSTESSTTTRTPASPSLSPETSGSDTPTPVNTPSASAPEATAVALEQLFTSPDGSLSFRYPTGWTIRAQATETYEDTERYGWTVHDTDGDTVLSLDVRTWMPPAGPPPLEAMSHQGPVTGMVDGLGNPVQVIVAGTPGHDGSSTSLMYGMAAGTGADTTLFDLRWGNLYQVSFAGSQSLGPYEQVNLAAEAEAFAASSRFRTEILPILQSFTAGPPPTHSSSDENAAADEETPSAEAACVGEQYTYEDLQGIFCTEAKAILQVVSDTGEPIGARGQRTEEYHCFWSSIGEVEAGNPDVLCMDRNTGADLLSANYLKAATEHNG